MKRNNDENLAFVFPPSLSRRLKYLQSKMNAKSPGEVIIKALTLLELSMDKKIELSDKKERKWEVEGLQSNNLDN